MTNAGQHPDLCSIATLLRLAADGELTPEQQARLDAHLAAHPEDAQRIAFERELKSACAKVCAPNCCAPPALRERVRACCCPAEQGSPQTPATADRAYWLRTVVSRFGALAALITLLAVVGFLLTRPGVPGADEPRVVTGRPLATALASFVRKEHARCTEGGPEVSNKFHVRRAGDVPGELELLVGRPVSLATILEAESGGLEFVDAGICHPPGGVALHIRFRPAGVADESRYVSLWVQDDKSLLEIEDGVTYTMGRGCDSVRFWRVDGIRYVLVCPDETEAPAAALALHSPGPTRSY